MAADRLPVPAGLDVRGQRLWREMTTQFVLGPTQLELLLEGCRLADRLDRFERLLAGDIDTWVEIEAPMTGDGPLKLIISSAITEARLHATALRGIVTELRQATLAGKAGAAPAPPPADPVAELADEVARKRRQRDAS